MITVCVSETDAGKRADAYLAGATGMTRSAVVRLLEEEYILADGNLCDKKQKVVAGMIFTVEAPEIEDAKAEPENIPLDILYEDDDVIVINKPCGMVVHPAPGNASGTLVNALLWHCGDSLSGIGGVKRPGIVHRIDKDTSGLLVVAKNDMAHTALSEQLKTHTVSRVYSAIALGNFKDDTGVVHAPIGRHPVDRKRMAVLTSPTAHAKDAVTHYQVLERFGKMTYLTCELQTGRTHQIRVHMAYLGHPLLGDPVYGGDGTRFEAMHHALIHGQCLHAGQLRFIHPRTGEAMTFSCPLPPDFASVLTLLREDGAR